MNIKQLALAALFTAGAGTATGVQKASAQTQPIQQEITHELSAEDYANYGQTQILNTQKADSKNEAKAKFIESFILFNESNNNEIKQLITELSIAKLKTEKEGLMDKLDKNTTVLLHMYETENVKDLSPEEIKASKLNDAIILREYATDELLDVAGKELEKVFYQAMHDGNSELAKNILNCGYRLGEKVEPNNLLALKDLPQENIKNILVGVVEAQKSTDTQLTQDMDMLLEMDDCLHDIQHNPENAAKGNEMISQLGEILTITGHSKTQNIFSENVFNLADKLKTPDTPTGVDNATTKSTSKPIKVFTPNGIVIHKDGKTFNLSGTRIE